MHLTQLLQLRLQSLPIVLLLSRERLLHHGDLSPQLSLLLLARHSDLLILRLQSVDLHILQFDQIPQLLSVPLLDRHLVDMAGLKILNL